MVNILPYNLLELRYSFLFFRHSLNKLLPKSLTIISTFSNTSMLRDIQVYVGCSAQFELLKVLSKV